MTSPSPDGAPEIAAGLANAGFPDVKLYVVVEASATSEDADLQTLHDRRTPARAVTRSSE